MIRTHPTAEWARIGMLVQQLLEFSAARTPDTIALVCGERRLSYRELDAAANRVAHALLEAGVRRGDRVAILLDNSPEAVIALFGALKAGGVFVGLHPSTKPDKLAYLLEDASPTALITDAARVRGTGAVLSAATSLRCILWAASDGRAVRPEVGHASMIDWSDLDGFSAARP